MLNLKTIFKILGSLLWIEATLLFCCLMVSCWYQGTDTIAFLWSILITIASGCTFRVIGLNSNNTLGRRDAYFVVAVSWILFSLFGTASVPHQWLYRQLHKCFLRDYVRFHNHRGNYHRLS